MTSRVDRAATGRAPVADGRVGNYWPSAEQELLLRAALLARADAGEAWRALRPRLDLDRLDHASQRLLPLLYHNLRRHGIEDGLLARFKGIYRHTWFKNQMLFNAAGRLLDALREVGISTMVLKGGALVAQYYRDSGLRAMNDFDILVTPAMAAPAIAVLRQHGWSPAYPVTPAFIQTKHAAPFQDPGGRDCDLHWHVFEECCRPGDDDDLWAASVALDIQGGGTRVLSPSDQLLHVCAHGAKWAPEPGIRWVADAMVILAAEAIDWQRVVTQAAKRRFVLRTKETLGYLRSAMGAPVPDGTLRALSAVPVSPIERLERRIRGRDHRVLGWLPIYWCQHLRLVEGGRLAAALTFPRYLQHAWGLESIGRVPRGAMARAARRIRAAVRD